MQPAFMRFRLQGRKRLSNEENSTGQLAAHHNGKRGLADNRNCPDPAQKDHHVGVQ